MDSRAPGTSPQVPQVRADLVMRVFCVVVLTALDMCEGFGAPAFCAAPPAYVAARRVPALPRCRQSGGRAAAAGAVMLWSFFGKQGEGATRDLLSSPSSLPAGHSTVNATTVEEERQSAAPEAPAAAPVTETPLEITQELKETWLAEGGRRESAGRDAYQDVMAKGELANNIAKRVRASPDDVEREMQLLEAQVCRNKFSNSPQVVNLCSQYTGH